MIANIEQETIDNVRRLRNHPSIAIWNGNNEVLIGWENWGWQRDLDDK
jgi:beta-mannosidase